MKFLCLAYGGEEGWNELTKQQQSEVLQQDEVLRKRGDFLAAVTTEVTTVSNWGGRLSIENESFAKPSLPLAGFSIVEAESIEEVIQLVANTPCARASGAIEIRPFWNFSVESDSKDAQQRQCTPTTEKVIG
jgi:hypothetical protein